MSTRRVIVPTFLGGVSQQSTTLRRSNAVEDAKNLEFLAPEGATRRHATQHVHSFGSDLGGKRCWTMERDAEDYIIILGDGSVEVIDAATGDSKTVTGGPFTYLSGAQYEDLRVSMLADTAFVLNRNVVTAGAAGITRESWEQTGEAGLFIRQGNYGTTYSLTYKTAAMVSEETVQYTTPGGPIAVGNFLAGADYVGIGGGITTDFVNGDSTILFNTRFNSESDLLFQIVGPGTVLPNDDFDCDPITKEVRYRGSTLAAGDTLNISIPDPFSLTYYLDPAIIRRLIAKRLTDAGAPLTEETGDRNSASARYSSPTAIETWELRVSAGPSFGSAWVETVEELPSLPLEFKHGAYARITGEDADRTNDYWVRFSSQEWAEQTGSDFDQFSSFSGFGPGTWNEASAPDLPDGALDASTMPHTLRRKQDDGAGTVTGTPNEFYFEWSSFDWAERTAGDAVTNKVPSFVGFPIQDIFIEQNRLGFLSQTELIMSETGEFDNFWRTTVLSVSDSERIDVSISGLEGDILYNATQFDGSLLILSAQGQAAVSGNPGLSPTSLQAPVLSSYRSFRDVSPVRIGSSLFFGHPAGQFSAIREYVPAFDDDSFEDQLVTLAVPRLIPQDVIRMAASSVDSTLAILTGSRDKLYVYQYLRVGSEQLQASWTTWDFSGDVDDMVFLQNRLMVLVTREGETHLEQIDLGPGRTFQGEDFVLRMDSQTPATFSSYDRATNTTTWTVPWDFTETESLALAADGAGTLPYGSEIPVSGRIVATRAIQAVGDYTGESVRAGRPYSSSVTLSEPIARIERRSGKVAIPAARTTIRELNLNLVDTGYLKAVVRFLDADSSEEEFLGSGQLDVARFTDSLLQDGTFTVGVGASPRDFQLELSSSSVLPFTLANGAWDTLVTTRHAIT